MKKNVWIALSIMIAFIGLVLFLGTNASNESKFLAKYGFEGWTVQEIVAHLEDQLAEPESFRAAITGSKLLLSDSYHQVELELPSGQFYLSFAPYIQQTHPCANHNLITCRGELKNESFVVKIIDLRTNTIFLETTIQSSSNGFAGIWLPANNDYQMTVTYGDLTATEVISTFSTSHTCLTTLKLT